MNKTLNIQRYLRKVNSLEKLESKYGVFHTKHDTLPLVILNYDQIESPKNSKLTRECRGLILELDTWNVVSKSFTRFFNYGESREEINKFDWTNFRVEEKHDGSLISLFYYNDQWMVATRGSFAQQSPQQCGVSWEELVWRNLDKTGLKYISKSHTFVLELVGPLNKVVVKEEEGLYLLTAFCKHTFREPLSLHCVANYLKIKQPKVHSFKSIEECIEYANSQSGQQHEGLVLKDTNGNRIKVKNKDYLRYHSMRGNGDNLFNPKYLVPYILKNETGELYSCFPEVILTAETIRGKMEAQETELKEIYNKLRGIDSQKEFAVKVLELCPRRFSGILFQTHKFKKPIEVVWRESEELIINWLKEESWNIYSYSLSYSDASSQPFKDLESTNQNAQASC